MRSYEELYIAKPDVTEEEIDALNAQLESVITTAGGKLERTDKWGVRKLAYRVSKHREGGRLKREPERQMLVILGIDRRGVERRPEVPTPAGEVSRNRRVGHAVQKHAGLRHARDGEGEEHARDEKIERSVTLQESADAPIGTVRSRWQHRRRQPHLAFCPRQRRRPHWQELLTRPERLRRQRRRRSVVDRRQLLLDGRAASVAL